MSEIKFVHADDGGHSHILDYSMEVDTETAKMLKHWLRRCHADGPDRTHIVFVMVDGDRYRALVDVTQFYMLSNAPPKNEMEAPKP